MNPRVLNVIPTEDYKLNLVFANGERREYDCTHLLDFGVFKELREMSYFIKVKPMHGSVVWPHEQDICPDTLYLDSRKID